MSVCLIVDVPGGTMEQYDAVLEGLGEPKLGDGQIAHMGGPTEAGFCVVDVWESRDDFDRFMQERLGAQLQAAGVPQPNVTQFEIQNSEKRG
jgi:hypothetical protein